MVLDVPSPGTDWSVCQTGSSREFLYCTKYVKPASVEKENVKFGWLRVGARSKGGEMARPISELVELPPLLAKVTALLNWP